MRFSKFASLQLFERNSNQHQKELDNILDENERYKRLVELNVQEQCINVIKAAEVQNAYRDRKIEVHG